MLGDCFKRGHILEKYNQQNFVLNIETRLHFHIPVSLYLKWYFTHYFVNKLQNIDGAKNVYEGKELKLFIL